MILLNAQNIYNYYHDLKTLRDCSDKALKYSILISTKKKVKNT